MVNDHDHDNNDLNGGGSGANDDEDGSLYYCNSKRVIDTANTRPASLRSISQARTSMFSSLAWRAWPSGPKPRGSCLQAAPPSASVAHFQELDFEILTLRV